VFGPERTGQVGAVPGVRRIPPKQPRPRKASTVWQSSWAAFSSLVLGAFTLADFFGSGRNPWWLHLVVGLFFVLVGLANLQRALKLRRDRRRLADAATGDANPG
jgi:hypothetical protein